MRDAALGAGAAGLEAVALVLGAGVPAFGPVLGWPAAAGLHALAALLAALGLGGGHPPGRFFAGALVLTLPGLGLGGLLLVRVWNALSPPRPDADTAHATLANLPGPELAAGSLDSVFAWMQSQLAVQPLAEAIHSEDPAMQRWAIQVLSRRGDGEAVELLREALQSANRDVQLLATNALQRIEERLTTRMEQAREAAQRQPDAVAVWVALGDACRAYQASRLLEPVMERHWLGEAERAYRRALDLDEDPAARLALGAVLCALGRVAEAEAAARAAAEARPSAEADALLGETLFAQGRWEELRDLARAAAGAGRASEALAWWTGDDDAR